LLIGTQMLAKGHHFPDVTLVGIVDADQGLYGIDFRASERMAQLILQVAGRAGRSDKPGTVIIQTHQPDHPLLRVLVTRGYPAFAEAALAERLAALLPPFACQALLRAEAAEADQATAFLKLGLALAEPIAEGVELLGPAPAPMERRAGRYRAQLLLQASHRQTLHRFLDLWTPQLWAQRADRRVRGPTAACAGRWMSTPWSCTEPRPPNRQRALNANPSERNSGLSDAEAGWLFARVFKTIEKITESRNLYLPENATRLCACMCVFGTANQPLKEVTGIGRSVSPLRTPGSPAQPQAAIHSRSRHPPPLFLETRNATRSGTRDKK